LPWSGRFLLAVSAQLLDPDHVARGIAQGTVANPVRLLGRFLDDLDVAGLQFLEGAVEVLGGQQERAVRALAIISWMTRRSSSERPGVASGGYRTILVSAWFGGPTVIQRILPPPTSRRTSKPRVSR